MTDRTARTPPTAGLDLRAYRDVVVACAHPDDETFDRGGITGHPDHQHAVMACHGSQLTDNPVPRRRSALQGPTEHLRAPHPPTTAGTRPADHRKVAT